MKILIVEDDFVVRQGIRLSLEWEKYNLSICADASNGKLGLELAKKLHPDIIITDIRMPIMDGLEFTEKVLSILPDVKIIILSGYDDFSYAQKALRLGVNDYMLKPVDADELLKCVCDVRDSALKEKEAREYRENLIKECEEEILHRAMEHFLHPLHTEEKEKIREELETIGNTIRGNLTYRVVILALENFLFLTKNFKRAEKKALSERVKMEVERAFGECCNAWCFGDGVGQFAVILGYDNMSRLHMDNSCLFLIQGLEEKEGILCAMSCGMEKHSMEEIYLSYEEALVALHCHSGQGENLIFHYTGQKSGENTLLLELYEDEKKIIDGILQKDSEEIEKNVEIFWQKAAEKQVSYEKLNAACVRLVSKIFNTLAEMEIPFKEDSEAYYDTLSQIRQFRSMGHLKRFMFSFTREVLSCLGEMENKKYSSVVEQAVNYVKVNYKNELTVKNLSQELFITPNYFSHIFKTEMGVNFTDYVNEVRIEYAKKLLRENRLKVYEVAEQLGYQNYKYFNKVFKKHTGYSPKEYSRGNV